MMKLTFLGTGTSQGVPMIGCDCEVCTSTDPRDKRLRTSALVQIERGAGSEAADSADTSGAASSSGAAGDSGVAAATHEPEAGPINIVIDAGPDFRAQMLAAGVRTLDGILLTHEHKDHTGGIDDVRAFNYFTHKAVDIYATDRVRQALRRDYAYAFADKPYPGAPEIDLHTIAQEPFEVRGVRVVPIAGMHMRLPITGYRIGPLGYLTDFNHIEESEIAKLQGVKVLVINAIGHKHHISHFNLTEALDVAARVGAPRTYLTHIAHRMGRYAEIEPALPAGVHMAYDGLSVTI